METCIGKIISISELNVQILLNGEKVKFHDVLWADSKGRRVYFEANLFVNTIDRVIRYVTM